jgi:hypothetical protein
VRHRRQRAQGEAAQLSVDGAHGGSTATGRVKRDGA